MVKRPKKDGHEKELTKDERELFLNAFYQGEIAPRDYESTGNTKAKTSHLSEDVTGEDRDLFLRAVNEGVIKAITYEKEKQIRKTEHKPSARKRQMVDAQIDLHGMFAEDAVNVLLRFIERELKRGSRSVLVVHGKGAGILKNAVWSVIESHPHVDDFQIAKAKFGGAGAIVVRLKRKRRQEH